MWQAHARCFALSPSQTPGRLPSLQVALARRPAVNERLLQEVLSASLQGPVLLYPKVNRSRNIHMHIEGQTGSRFNSYLEIYIE